MGMRMRLRWVEGFDGIGADFDGTLLLCRA